MQSRKAEFGSTGQTNGGRRTGVRSFSRRFDLCPTSKQSTASLKRAILPRTLRGDIDRAWSTVRSQPPHQTHHNRPRKDVCLVSENGPEMREEKFRPVCFICYFPSHGVFSFVLTSECGLLLFHCVRGCRTQNCPSLCLPFALWWNIFEGRTRLRSRVVCEGISNTVTVPDT